MVKCKLDCPKKIGTVCCSQCEHNATCDEACADKPSTSTVDGCGNAIFEGEETGVELFQTKNTAIIKSIADICTAKKKLEEQEKKLKEQLKLAMEQNDVKKFTSDILNITYIAATTSTTVDSKKLKESFPEIYQQCSKTSNKSAYVKVEVK